MTGQELIEHVRGLAKALNVHVWVNLDDLGVDGAEPWGAAGEDHAGENVVWLSTVPDTPVSYLVALHELGHHIDPDAFTGLRLDREAYAWRWALRHSLIEPDVECWLKIVMSLHSYGEDRRYKRTPAFCSLLAEAREAAVKGMAEPSVEGRPSATAAEGDAFYLDSPICSDGRADNTALLHRP